MLARIQTLYLVLAALLALGTMALPFWSFSSTTLFLVTDFSSFPEAGVLYAAGSYGGGILSPLTALASLGAVFLFSKRDLQRKLILLALLFFVGDLLAGLTAAHFLNLHFESLGGGVAHGPEAGLFLMLPEPILFWLALKGVEKDEKIANAYKRL